MICEEIYCVLKARKRKECGKDLSLACCSAMQRVLAGILQVATSMCEKCGEFSEESRGKGEDNDSKT